MDLYEYQARDLFESHGVPAPRGIVARTPDEAYEAARSLNTTPVVVKAQVKIGGRGKAGGVKLAVTPDEARDHATQILGMDIKGHTVGAVMIAEGIDIAKEFYFSLLVDRAERTLLAMSSLSGGMDIEQLANERPDELAKIRISPTTGLDADAARRVVEETGFDASIAGDVTDVLVRLGDVFRETDATLVEVNPLVRTGDGRILAADGKITLDDNARFRHPEFDELVDHASSDPLERKAAELGLNYVKLDGNVGIIGNGAGLVMSTLDVVAAAGRDLPGRPHPANFLDIGGGASATIMSNGLSIILSDAQVRSVFVNIFGGITSCTEVANGIVEAVGSLPDLDKPIVVRLDGNDVESGRSILHEFNHPLVTVVETMDDAARQAATLASEKEN